MGYGNRLKPQQTEETSSYGASHPSFRLSNAEDNPKISRFASIPGIRKRPEDSGENAEEPVSLSQWKVDGPSSVIG